MNARSLRVVVVGGVLAVGLPLALWAMSAASISPEQRIADAEPPPAPTVDVEVEERRLEDTIVVRGSITAATEQEVAAPESGESTPVIVDLPVAEGEAVEAGQVVAVVADRPLIVLPMPVGLYRSLDPTSEGTDVERFQQALEGLGHDIDDDERARFGSSTQAAVGDLYEDAGFPPARTGAEADERLESARDQRRSASQAVEDAEDALERQRTARSRQRDELADAEERLEEAESGDGGAGSDGNAVDQAQSAVDSARQGLTDAEDAVSAAQRDLSRAQETLDDATQARDEAAARVGVTVPAGEVVAVEAFPVVVSSVAARVGQAADGPILTLTPSSFVLEATVDPSVAGLFEPGVRAVAGDDAWEAEVVSNQGRDDSGRPVVTLAPDEPLELEMLGSEVRVEAEIAATDGEVLAVPVTAIRSGADGEYLRVVRGEDDVERVAVTTGASIGGWVEIVEPPDGLEAGTVVRVE